MKNRFVMLAAFALLQSAVFSAAHADIIPYPNIGSPNSTTYTFTAAATGDVTAYIVGGFSAGYDNELGLLDNGVAIGGYGLNNHSSSVGQSFDFGSVNAGDSLVFVLDNLTLGKLAYSDPSMNVSYDSNSSDGHNHIYSTPYTATSPLFAGVPAGTYVAFEDLPFPGADFNYNDESFVFTNVASTPSTVPEPSTLLLLGAGLAGAGFLRKRSRK